MSITENCHSRARGNNNSGAEGTSITPFHYFLLLILSLLMFLPGLATMPPVDRDEPRYAQASKQMIENGDYLDIHFMQETRYKKPIGIYWLQSASARIFGTPPYDEIWPYRLPSLLGAVLAVLLTAWGVARIHGAKIGMLAGAILLCTPLLNFEARIAKTDAALLATICLTQFILAQAYIKPEPLSGRLVWLFWLGQAAGILIKGPLTPLISFCTVVTLCLCDRQCAWFRKLRPWRGMVLCAALVAPWLIWIGIASHGTFYSESTGHDFLGKVLSGQDRGFLPPGYHAGLFFILFAPGVCLALRGLALAWRQRAEPAMRFILAWIIPAWIINELIFTKLPHYVLPCYPPLAWVAAYFLIYGTSIKSPQWQERFWHWLNLACGGIILAVLGATVFFPYAAGVPFIGRLAALGMVAAFMLIMQMRWQWKYPLHALLCGIVAMVVLMKAGLGLLVPSLKPILITPLATTAYAANRPCPFSHLITSGYTEPSIAFMAGTQTLFANGATYAARLLSRDTCAVVMIAPEQEQEFMAGLMVEKTAAERLGTIRGYSYNGGGWKNFTFFRVAPCQRFVDAE